LRGRFRGELRGVYLFERVVDTERPEVRAALDLWWFGARGCARFVRDIVEFAACAGLEAGSLRASASGVMQGVRRALPWVALDAGATVHIVPWRRFGFLLGLELAVPMTRPGFTVENLGEVFRAAPIAGSLYGGLEVRLP
jgi:hypothetical protein